MFHPSGIAIDDQSPPPTHTHTHARARARALQCLNFHINKVHPSSAEDPVFRVKQGITYYTARHTQGPRATYYLRLNVLSMYVRTYLNRLLNVK